MFICDKCGLCCKNLQLSPLYSSLNRGDGICKYFDDDFNLCTIYEKRPILCNIDEAFKTYFSDKMTQNEYYKLNYQICNQLKLK